MRVLLTIFTCLFCSPTFSQACFPNGIQFSSQEDIDNFPLENPTCTIIIGDVIIQPTEESIYSLLPLSNIIEIGGNLSINNQDINSLIGFEGLVSIGGELKISCGDIYNFRGFDNLTEVGGDLIVSGYNLTNASGFESLKTVNGSFFIGGSNLQSFNGLENLNHIGGDFRYSAYENLENHNGLSNLRFVGGDFRTDAESFVGLESLDTILGNLEHFPKVETGFDGLENLSIIGGDLAVNSFTESDTNQLPSLHTIGGDLDYRASLGKSFNGLFNLQHVGGNLKINALSLDTLTGLQALEQIDGQLELTQVRFLEEIQSFQNLTTVGSIKIGGTKFEENLEKLINLNTFNKVKTVTDSVFIYVSKPNGEIAIFEELDYVGGSMYLHMRTLDFSGLTELDSIGGNLYILSDIHEDNLYYLDNLKQVGGDFTALNMPEMRLSKLEYVGGSFYIEDVNHLHELSELRFIGHDFTINTIWNKEFNLFSKLENVGNNVLITGLRNVIDLNGFDKLRTVGGFFNIHSIGKNYESVDSITVLINDFKELDSIGSFFSLNHNGKISDTAFDKLEFVGSNFRITTQNNLKGFNSLRKTGGNFYIRNQDGIIGFSNLDTVIGKFELESFNSSVKLLTFEAFENLKYVGSTFKISNAALEPYNKFEDLNHLGANSILSYLSSDQPIRLLENVTFVGDYIDIIRIESDSISLFNSVEAINGDLEFRSNKFTSSTLFSNVKSINGKLLIEDNILDQNNGSLKGFSTLISVSESVTVKSNNYLTDIDFFGKLEDIGGSLLINGWMINSISGLKELKSIGGNLNLSDIDELTDLLHLSKLVTLEGHLTIHSLNGITSLEGLDGIDPYSLSGDNGISITYCENLSICNIKSICEYLRIPDTEAAFQNNAEGCNSIEELNCESDGLSGTIYYDYNQNGIQDITEIGIENTNVIIDPDAFLYKTNSFGHFYKLVEENLYYTVSLSLDEEFEITSDSLQYSSLYTIGNPDNSEKNFGLIYKEEKSYGELSISSPRVRCNETSAFFLRLKNLGSNVEVGELYFNYDPRCTFLASSITPNSINESEHLIIYTIDELLPFNVVDIKIDLKAPNETFTGNPIYFNTSWSSNSTDLFLEENFDTHVACSYDPNDKLVNPVGESTNNEVLIGTDLEYTIRFQNTGNDTAYNVRIKDIIPLSLDIESIEILNSSHPYTARTRFSVMEFFFDNIYLPDSLTDEENSHGFITFRIPHKGDVTHNTVVRNRASIFFDFNEPIITDYANTTLVDEITSNKNLLIESNKSFIHPNPANGLFFLNVNQTIPPLIEVYNSQGSLIKKEKTKKIDLSSHESGVYFVKFEMNGFLFHQKLIKI